MQESMAHLTTHELHKTAPPAISYAAYTAPMPCTCCATACKACQHCSPCKTGTHVHVSLRMTNT